METVEIKVAGKAIQARAGETVIHALWAAGMAESVKTGCAGGVCGACTITVRFPEGRSGGTDLACICPVEEGMEIFPMPSRFCFDRSTRTKPNWRKVTRSLSKT